MNDAPKDQLAELAVLAKPLHDWLQDNFCPHDSIIIRCGHVELVSGCLGVPMEIKD